MDKPAHMNQSNQLGMDAPAKTSTPKISAKLFQCLSHEGHLIREHTLDKETTDVLLQIYRSMRLIRLLDERMVIFQRQGRIGFYGSCTGQEAGPVATAAALRDTDWVFPSLREGAIMLHRGFSLSTYIAQVFGNKLDSTKGRQMPSHQADKSVHQVSWSSCIGPQIPQAVGAAYAMKNRKSSDIAVGFMGDGATSSQDFHVGMNFAGVFKVPVLLICQNNHWSISVPTAKQTASTTIAEKAIAYGMPFVRVDGNDALAVYLAVREAADHARSGYGPVFLEFVTYRIGAHSTSDDPRVYRSEAEVEEWKLRDPITRLYNFLFAQKLWDQNKDESLTLELKEKINEAVNLAEPAENPDVVTLFDDVYADISETLSAQKEELISSMTV